MTTEADRAGKRKYTKLTPAMWAEIEAHWQTGEVTLAELSEKYGPSPRALQSHFAKAGIVKGEKAAAMAAAVREKVLEEEFGNQDQLVARAKDIRERAYRNANIVEDLIMAQLALAEREPAEILKAGAALKMLSLAAGSLERVHDLKKRALGLDKDSVFSEEMPELIIRCLTDEEVAKMQDAQEQEDFGDEIIPDDEDGDVEPVDPEADEIVIEDSEGHGRRPEPRTPAHTDSEGFRLVREAGV
jgi:lambda repressor-like predicted transcriptional regulator